MWFCMEGDLFCTLSCSSVCQLSTSCHACDCHGNGIYRDFWHPVGCVLAHLGIIACHSLQWVELCCLTLRTPHVPLVSNRHTLLSHVSCHSHVCQTPLSSASCHYKVYPIPPSCVRCHSQVCSTSLSLLCTWYSYCACCSFHRWAWITLYERLQNSYAGKQVR